MITFLYMNIEQNYYGCPTSGVEVSEQATIIGKSCGTQGHNIVSWENSVTMRFYADRYEADRTFTAEYSAISYDVAEPEESMSTAIHDDRMDKHYIHIHIS